MTWRDPYHLLGLYRNPFVSEDIDELIETTWINRGLSQPPSIRAKMFVQVKGAIGAGKTSHLLYWQRQTDGFYVCYPPHPLCQDKGNRWCIPPIGDIAYWDEAQGIPISLLLLALGKAAIHKSTIVAATHCDLSWAAKLVGLRIKTITLPPLDIKTLLQWGKQRIEMARIPTTKVTLDLTSEVAELILAKSNNSWREAATYLHVWAAGGMGRCGDGGG